MATLKKSDPLRLLGRRLLLLFLAALVLSMAWGVWDIYRKNAEAALLRSQAEAQLAALSARETKLQADYSDLNSSRGMEAALRDSYAVGRSGEGMIVIVEPKQSVPAQASSTSWGWIQRAFSWW